MTENTGRCSFSVTSAELPCGHGGFSCWRKPVEGAEHCIWHWQNDGKDASRLRQSRAEHPERLDGAYLVDVDFDGAFSFAGCGLSQADFSESQVYQVDFSGACLSGARFERANCTESDFARTNLEAADYTGAVLSGARFERADLAGASLESAQMMMVNFREANLTDVENAPDVSEIGLALDRFTGGTGDGERDRGGGPPDTAAELPDGFLIQAPDEAIQNLPPEAQRRARALRNRDQFPGPGKRKGRAGSTIDEILLFFRNSLSLLADIGGTLAFAEGIRRWLRDRQSTDASGEHEKEPNQTQLDEYE